MKIRVKDLAVDMELGNNGITLDVYDTKGLHLGDARFGRSTIEWCPGKTHAGNGHKVKWVDFIEWMKTQGKS